MKYICAIGFIFLAIVSGKRFSNTCIHEEHIVHCHCIENKEFDLPKNYNFVNLTTLLIESCDSVNIELVSSSNLKLINDIQIQNITGKLIFEPNLKMKNFGKIWLRNIGNIPTITHKTFLNIRKIDSFIIENTRIKYLNEQFTDIDVNIFNFNNVIIDNMVGINWSGQSLKIINTIMRNVNGDFNFESLDSIVIINSTIEFNKPGQMSIYGSNARIINSVFSNISINLVAGSVVMSDNCGDGISSLRLSSDWVKSIDNRMPTEIIYTNNRSNLNMFSNINNTVCKAGNCKCQKNSQHNCHNRMNANIYLGIILLILLSSF
ncbi:hypothetical protein PV325_002830 [Microctonus aethiopoides]|nr:hypothetical protein PV325_002830 [Microctonus aethiopoides]